MQQYAHANVGDQIVVKGPNEVGATGYGAGSFLLARESAHGTKSQI